MYLSDAIPQERRRDSYCVESERTSGPLIRHQDGMQRRDRGSPLANSAGELRRFEPHLEQGAMEAPPISQILQATAYILAFHE